MIAKRPVLAGSLSSLIRGLLFIIYLDLLTWEGTGFLDSKIPLYFIVCLVLTSISFYFFARVSGASLAKFYLTSELFYIPVCVFLFFSGFSVLPRRELNAADGLTLLVYIPTYLIAAGAICLCLFLLLKNRHTPICGRSRQTHDLPHYQIPICRTVVPARERPCLSLWERCQP